MAIPKNKTELLSDIRTYYQKLKKDLNEIDENLVKFKDLDGHAKATKMSVLNLVSYLIGWGELVLKWNKIIEKGGTPIFPEENFKWTELGPLAQKFYSDYEKLSYQEALLKLDMTVNNIICIIEKTSNEKLYKGIWYKKYPMGRMIQLNTSSPYKNARSRIRKWKRLKSKE